MERFERFVDAASPGKAALLISLLQHKHKEKQKKLPVEIVDKRRMPDTSKLVNLVTRVSRARLRQDRIVEIKSIGGGTIAEAVVDEKPRAGGFARRACLTSRTVHFNN